jgi:hypothetical protein
VGRRVPHGSAEALVGAVKQHGVLQTRHAVALVSEEEAEEQIEVVDGVPVLAEPRELAPARPPVPARQAAALAATGFVAGAATVAVVRRRRARVAAKRRKKRGGVLGEIVTTNSFLVDVHLVRRG